MKFFINAETFKAYTGLVKIKPSHDLILSTISAYSLK